MIIAHRLFIPRNNPEKDDLCTMQIELNDLMEQLQGHWKLDNEEQNFEINGKELTVYSNGKSVKMPFELTRNLQLSNWQIKAGKSLSWLRTFVVKIDPDTFMLYDFDPNVQVALAARSRMLNPSRVYRYSRVAVEVGV
jgi:hypothetical protein